MGINFVLSSPQDQVRNMLAAFFSYDIDVKVDDTIENGHIINVRCSDQLKYKALDLILRKSYLFGDREINVSVHFSGHIRQPSPIFNINYSECDLVEIALSHNALFNRLEVKEMGEFKVYFCMMNREIIQYPNEDLTDFYCLESTLAENIAVQIFDVDNVFYCTVVEETALKERYN